MCTEEACDKTFRRKRVFEDHLRRQHGAPRLKCSYLDCGKAFLSEDNHSAHMRVHLYNPSKLEDTLNYVVEKWAPSKIEKIEKPSLSHEKSDKRKDTRDTLNYVVEKWAPFMGDMQRYLQIPPEDVQEMMEKKQIGKLKYLSKEENEKPSLVNLQGVFF